MSIIKTVYESQFIQAFQDSERENFSYEGLIALFGYLEQLSEDMGEDIELDIIALCCDYSEYETLKDFQDQYGDQYKSIEDIEEKTTVIKVDDDKFIIQNF